MTQGMDDLAMMRAGQEGAQVAQPTGPMAPPEGMPPQTAAPPQYGDARAAGVAPAPPDPAELVTVANGIKIRQGIAPAVQALIEAVPGLIPTDGARDKKEQQRANPRETESKHLDGTAVDFQGSARDLQKAYKFARENGGKEVHLGNHGRGYRLHVAWDEEELNQQAQAAAQQQAPGMEQGMPPEGMPPEAMMQ